MDLINDKLHVDTNQGVKIVTIDPNDFSIDEANLEGELCNAGVLLCYYGDLAAELDAKASNMKNLVDEARGLECINLRNQNSGKKLTENMLEELIVSSKAYQVLRSTLVNAQKEALKAQNLFRAMNQRVECLKALSYRTGRQEKNAF